MFLINFSVPNLLQFYIIFWIFKISCQIIYCIKGSLHSVCNDWLLIVFFLLGGFFFSFFGGSLALWFVFRASHSGTILLKACCQPFSSSHFGDRVSHFAQSSLDWEPPISSFMQLLQLQYSHQAQLFSINIGPGKSSLPHPLLTVYQGTSPQPPK
jgi:hypothetical protein